jgi:hypothetical protein
MRPKTSASTGGSLTAYTQALMAAAIEGSPFRREEA